MKIYCSKGVNINQRYRLNDGRVNIGRSTSNDIVIDDITCSRQHIALIIENNLAFLVNLKAMNPVCLNGRLVTAKLPLRSGDVITLGETEFTMLDDHEDPAVKDEVAYESYDTVHIDVRKALQEVMNQDMERVSVDATTRIKQSALSEIQHLFKNKK